MTPVVSVRGLTKSYRDFEALKGVDFELRAGEVFGLLGPNGAGKTTTIEILEGYRRRDAGEVEVLGADPESAGLAWRGRIGVVLQSSAMYENITVAEELAQFAGYYEHPRPVDEVIELIGLEEKRDTRARRLSGGQRRRLDLGLALIGDPELIFLDEPTTGFDPGARRRAWETIRSLSGLGKTILLTTHYLDEVEQLADRVAVLREGRIVASGTVQELVGGMPATEFQAGNLTLAVMDPSAFGQPEAHPNSVPIALQVDDVEAARTELQGKGVTFHMEMLDSGVCHQAIFTDPDGNPLILHHRYAPNPGA